MQPILEENIKSFGGVLCHHLYIVEADGILTDPDVQLGYKAAVELKPAFNWAEIRCRKNTIRFTESNTTDGGVSTYSARITFEVKRDHYETVYKILQMTRKGLMVRFTDRNNNVKLMGSPTAPVRTVWERDNDTQMQNTNKLAITFVATDRLPVVQTVE
jgi:hypothetical protein